MEQLKRLNDDITILLNKIIQINPNFSSDSIYTQLNDTKVSNQIDRMAVLRTNLKNELSLLRQDLGRIKNVLYDLDLVADKMNSYGLFKGQKGKVDVLQLPKGELLKPHISNDDVLLIVVKGKMRLTIEGKEYLLSEWDSLSIDHGAIHSVESIEELTFLLIR
jgi:mannose-6-phosphate isomerase-like protein (cupin superfamily)